MSAGAFAQRVRAALPEWWVFAGAGAIIALVAAGAAMDTPRHALASLSGIGSAPADRGGAFAGAASPLFWAALAGFLWWLVRNRVRPWRIGHRGGHLVIAGGEPVALPIVAGERARGTRAIMLANGKPARWMRWAERAGSPYTSRLHGILGKARLVILAEDDDDANIAAAARIVADPAATADRSLPLPTIVRIDDTSRQQAAEARLAASKASDRVQLRYVSLPVLIARALLRAGLVDRVDRRGAAERLVLVVRYTPVIEQYLLDLIVGGHARDHRPTHLVVLDPDADRHRAALLERWPGAARLTLPDFIATPIDHPAALADAVASLLERHGAAPAAVVIETTDPALANAQAAAIDAVMQARDEPPPAYGLHLPPAAIAPLAAPVEAFGGATLGAHDELVLFERHEQLARAVHEFYLEGRLDEGEALGSRPAVANWDDLPEAIRDDNRLLVTLYALKLRDIGARIAPGRGAPFAFSADEVDDLARAEHARWAAARLLAGWRYGPVRDEAERRHPDLVDQEERGMPVADRDREQVRIVARLLSRFGQHPVRHLRIGVDERSAAMLADEIAEVAVASPDRQVVAVGDPAQPAVREALAAAAAAGHPVQLVLTRHPAAIATELTADAGRRLRHLVAVADRIRVPAAGESVEAVLAALCHHRTDPTRSRKARRRSRAVSA